MSKHTPGPWTISDLYLDDSNQPELAIQAVINGKVCHPAAVCLQFPNMQDMQMANARLIAAAPELLKELKKMCRAYVCLLDGGRDKIISLGGDCDTVEIMEASNPTLSEARAIIAKATGQ